MFGAKKRDDATRREDVAEVKRLVANGELLDNTQKRSIVEDKVELDKKLDEQVITKLELFFGRKVTLSAESDKCNIIEFPSIMSFDAIKKYMDILNKIGLKTDRVSRTFYMSGYRLGTDRIYNFPSDSNYLIIRNTLAEILEKFNNAAEEVSLNDKQREALMLNVRRGIRHEHLIGKSWFNSDDHVYALGYLMNDMTVDDALTKIKDLSPEQLKNIENEPASAHQPA